MSHSAPRSKGPTGTVRARHQRETPLAAFLTWPQAGRQITTCLTDSAAAAAGQAPAENARRDHPAATILPV